MAQDPLAIEFRRKLEEMHLPLKNPGPEDDRFVFELDEGEIVIDPHPSQARQLLLLAEAVYTKGHGAALELARLVAKREMLEEDAGAPHVVRWRHAGRTLAAAVPTCAIPRPLMKRHSSARLLDSIAARRLSVDFSTLLPRPRRLSRRRP